MNDRSSSLSVTEDIVHSVEGLNLMGYNEKPQVKASTTETSTSKALLDPDSGVKKKTKTMSMEESRMSAITKSYKDVLEKKDDEDERKPIGNILRKEFGTCPFFPFKKGRAVIV